MKTSPTFKEQHLFPYTILGYYVLVNGQVFSGVTGRRMWRTKRAASRMLNYCLALHGLDIKQLKVEYKPIRLYPNEAKDNE